MLPIRRFASLQAVQATRTLRPSSIYGAAFHTTRVSASPIPESTDNVTSTTSKNTEGKGPNEKNSKTEHVHNEYKGDKSTPANGESNPNKGKVASPSTSSSSKKDLPKSPSAPKNPPSAGFSTFARSFATGPTVAGGPRGVTTADDLKTSAKTTANQVKVKVANAVDGASEAARHVGAKAGVGMDYAKEEVKHAVNQTKGSLKASAREAQAASTLYSPNVSSQPTTPYTSGQVSDPAAPLDTEAVKAKAREAASNVKATLGSVMESVKGVAQSVAETVKGTTAGVAAKAADMKENTGDRMAAFGERMEAKFERVGENLMKSGEAIERRNQQPDTPVGQPLPLDEVDHMPNPKDLNDVLPGTGAKDQKKNEPLADGSGTRGQFPG